jgi:hypothetical protein
LIYPLGFLIVPHNLIVEHSCLIPTGMLRRVLIIDEAKLIGAMFNVLLLNFKGEVELIGIVKSLFLQAMRLDVERIVDSK